MSGRINPGEADNRQSYFYVSYAHSSPLAGSRSDSADARVRRFFEDLADAVQRHARLRPHLVAGYFDQDMPPGPSRRAALELAIGAAEVFVPLYSPNYITRSWPGREWACFEARMKEAGMADPLQRFAGVLWVPVRGGQPTPGLLPAEDLLPRDAARTYRQNGLWALMAFSMQFDIYNQVVEGIARHIVGTAEITQVRPSAVPDISLIQSKFGPRSDAPIFVVVAVAPAPQEQGNDKNQIAATAGPRVWQPFGRDEEYSAIEEAVAAAEQLDYAVQVTGIDEIGDLLGHAPGVILIDPRYIADDRRRDVFRRLVTDLPRWVLPVLVFGQRKDEQTAQLADAVRKLLGRSRTVPARKALQGVSSSRAFRRLIPDLVAEAERQYVQCGPRERSALDQSSVSGVQRAASADRISGYVFISYDHEDHDEAERLQKRLQDAGVPVWTYITGIRPGDDRNAKIREAISDGTLAFLACFSTRSIAQATSSQNAEVQMAIKQMRQRNPGKPWLIPVRFDECKIPDLEIGGDVTLRSLERVDLFGDRYEENAGRLVNAVLRMLGRD